MSNDKVRAEFEAWMASQGLETEWQAERNAYKHFTAHFAYQAYQASRAALVVELPDDGLEDCFREWRDSCRDDFDTGYCYATDRIVAAIEAAGVRKTIKINTADMSGAALDWAVAVACGYKIKVRHSEIFLPNSNGAFVREFSPSTDWGQGGPLLQSYGVWLSDDACPDEGGPWVASLQGVGLQIGETPLVTAARAIVYGVLGDTVDVPAELVEALA